MGLSSVSLGHAYDRVLDRVKKGLDKGVNFQRPSSIELEAAEKFLSLIPCHERIKFAKNGSTVTTAAVKIARAKTDRDLVAFPADQPFYSYDDWFIGTTPCNKGIPDAIKDLSLTYNSTDLNSLRELFKKYPKKIACVISEPERSQGIPDGYLEELIDLCHENGALFIMDEMITGFKAGFPGSISKYEVVPDMATWGKGIANGFSFCCLTGKAEIMDLGGIKDIGKEKVFLISSTHGAETHSLAAAIETIDIFKELNVIEHNHDIGQRIISESKKLIKGKEVDKYIDLIECKWFPIFIFKDKEGKPYEKLRSLFLQEMIKRGVLFQGIFMPCFSHNENEIDLFLQAMNESLDVYKKALFEGAEKYLIGEECRPVFRKYI